MKSVICVLALLAVAFAYPDGGVVRFSIKELEEDLKVIDLLTHGTSRLQKYQFINCGTATDALNVTTLNLTPDPITFPGTLGVDFAGEFRSTLDAPLSAQVTLERKVGSTYIKIPCIGSIGSCAYDDLCQMLNGATCPPPFVTNGVPCKCPFTKGSYKLPSVSFEVDAAVFPPGDYHAKGELTFGGKSAGCVELYASFA